MLSTLSNLFNPFPAPHPRYYYDLSTELSPALQLSIPVGPHHTMFMDLDQPRVVYATDGRD